MRAGWKIFEPAVSYSDRAAMWLVVAERRAERGDHKGWKSAMLMWRINRGMEA